jgi:hypothetical protein
MERRRLIRVVENPVRKELESFVYAWNTPLKEAVKTMDIITLLRNANPIYRPDFANKCKEAGLLGIEEGREFLRLSR